MGAIIFSNLCCTHHFTDFMLVINKDSNLNTTSNLQEFCQKSLDSSKASDIVAIDVHQASSITDLMMICTGTSNRHVCAIAEKLVLQLAQSGIRGVAVSGQNEGLWVLVDVGNVIVHIMQESARTRYNLEDLYSCIAAGDAVN